MNGKRSIKKSERNTPVKKSIRVRKAKVETDRRSESGLPLFDKLMKDVFG